MNGYRKGRRRPPAEETLPAACVVLFHSLTNQLSIFIGVFCSMFIFMQKHMRFVYRISMVSGILAR
ncbi:hypothetical protein DWY69_29150 [Eisenbergiella massiliensis]|uniref:Uncharacterized protein n=1 Tax=Eisenbergiella massiliensis TaxID=1720294 RepID=A0A3E3I6E9_9FIRM|nr:hypothetical protein DWY69_29150 [Eisenbergiella massiliensis]